MPRPTTQRRFKLAPTGKNSTLAIINDTLKVTLLEDRTFEVSATIFAKVHAKSWIGIGHSFGIFGCKRITVCSGQEVSYRAKLAIKLSIKVNWDQETGRIAILIMSVKTNVLKLDTKVRRNFWLASLLHHNAVNI